MFRNATAADLDAVYRLMCALEERALPRDAFTRIYRAQLDDPRMQGIVCALERGDEPRACAQEAACAGNGAEQAMCDQEETPRPSEPVPAVGWSAASATAGDDVVAFINLRYEDQLHHAARIAEVLELVVDPAQRSQGIGGRLFDYACGQARAHGCQQIELTTNQLRHDAHRFYARKGMLNSHYKFTLPLNAEAGAGPRENRIGC